MALSSIRFLKRLHLFRRYNNVSSYKLGQHNQFSSCNRYKTEEKLIYFEDSDNFGSLGVYRHTPNTLDNEGDIKEQKYLQNATLPSQKLTIQQYSDLIKQFVKHKRLKEAIDVLEVKMLTEDRVKPENYVYNILIGACAEVGYTKKAFKLFNDMKRRALKPTGDTYTCLFHACANSPWPLDGLKNAKLLKAHMVDKEIEPNLTNYNSMIKAFGRCGDLTSAFKIVDEMIRKKIKIRVHTFNHLLHGCICDKKFGLRHALMVWRKMLVMKEKPNIYSFNLILRCVKECNLGTKEDIEELISSFRKHVIESSGPHKLLDNPRLSLAASEYCHNSVNISQMSDTHDMKYLSSESALNENENIDIASDNSDLIEIGVLSLKKSNSSDELRNMPNLLSKVIKMQDVLALKGIQTVQERFAVVGGTDDFLKEMEEYSVKPDIKTFTQIMSLLDNTREAEIKLIEKMKSNDIKPDIDFYNMLIKKRCLRSDYDGAREVKDMIEFESKRRNKKYPFKKKLQLKPNVITYGVLAMACDTKEKAQCLLTEMEDKQLKINIEILGALLRQGAVNTNVEYVLFIMDVATQNNLKPNDMFIKHLESVRDKCVNNLQQNTDRKKSEVFLKACKNFLKIYGKWIKEINIEELQAEHPWKQFRELHSETIQRQNIQIIKPKKFYKRNRKYVRYTPPL